MFPLPVENCTVFIFGGTGDLARRKLVPAFYNLYLQRRLPEKFALVGIGRSEMSSESYREELAAASGRFSPATWSREGWSSFAELIFYQRGELEGDALYPALASYLESDRSAGSSNCLFYLALAPNLFAPAAAGLHRNGFSAGGSGWRRIMVEKPFGYNLPTARTINAALCASFGEENIYHVDHYLGKEMLLNVEVIRFANSLFEPLWNNRYIDNVQISALESDGVGDRGRYYDRAGAMRDMLQSHLLQMLAVMAMEPPHGQDLVSIRQEKLNLLKTVRLWPTGAPAEKMVLGRYSGFLDETDISPDSEADTFIALKLSVENDRWQGVPFYLRSGKKLQDKMTKMVIQYKQSAGLELPIDLKGAGLKPGGDPNLLTLKVQPSEGVVIQFNIRKPATGDDLVVPVEMDFCQPCAFMVNSPEAYERLLFDAIQGDQTRFSSWEEIAAAWTLTDSIAASYRESGEPLYLYNPASVGPAEAEKMLTGTGRKWWD